MRIIGGTLSGQKLKAPEGRTTRPMLDRIRESLFNILEHHDWGRAIGDPIENACVLDAFCGTGALAFEAISRGAARAVLFDKDRNALRATQENAKNLEIEDRCRILPANTLQPPPALMPCRLVFIAPPYRKNLVVPALEALDAAGWIAPHALIVIETAKKETLTLPEKYEILLSRSYGDTALSFASATRSE